MVLGMLLYGAGDAAVWCWGCMGLEMSVSGDVWGCLGMSGDVWGCLGMSGNVYYLEGVCVAGVDGVAGVCVAGVAGVAGVCVAGEDGEV